MPRIESWAKLPAWGWFLHSLPTITPHFSTHFHSRNKPITPLPNSLNPIDFRHPDSNPPLPVRMTYSVNNISIDNW
jgi:hypothetical protein